MICETQKNSYCLLVFILCLLFIYLFLFTLDYWSLRSYPPDADVLTTDFSIGMHFLQYLVCID